MVRLGIVPGDAIGCTSTVSLQIEERVMKRFQRKHLVLAAAAAAAISSAFASRASAATDVWTGNSGVDTNWNTSGNWVTGVPALGGALGFAGTKTRSHNNGH